MAARADIVATDDLLIFANAAVTSTGQREFRSTAAEQSLTLDFLHAYVLGNYRELYAAVLALEINDYNAARIVLNLLRTTRDATPEQRCTEGRLIARRLAAMPPQRVYRLFRALRAARVNNRRTRAVVRDWIAARPDPVLDAVKYRGGLKAAARHAHLDALPEESGLFLFAPARRRPARYDAPLLDAWRRAHYEKRAVHELPYTVAEGFAARHGIPREQLLTRYAPRLTRLERLRLQGSGGGVLDADALGAMPLTRLASYAVGLPLAERRERRAALDAALRTAARRAAGHRAGSWGRIEAVLDDSYSARGSAAKRNRPLAVALACRYLLTELAAPGACTARWTSGGHDALLARPTGDTPLGDRIVDAVASRPDRLIVVSDGWDNAPPGLAGAVLDAWRTRIDPRHRTAAVHLNPVLDAGEFDVRRLTRTVPTVGIRDAEDLPALVELARFTDGSAGLAELRAHLDDKVRRFLAEDPAPTPAPATAPEEAPQ